MEVSDVHEFLKVSVIYEVSSLSFELLYNAPNPQRKGLWCRIFLILFLDNS